MFAPFDNTAKLFWKCSWQFCMCRMLTIWTLEKKFFSFPSPSPYDTFSIRKTIVPNIFFYFNSFDRNTFFLSENLFFFIMVTMSHHTRCVLRKIIFIKSYTFCCTHILWIIKFIKIFYNSRWLTIWTNGKFLYIV